MKFFPAVAAVAVSVIGGTSGVIYLTKSSTSKCANTIDTLQERLETSTSAIEDAQLLNDDLISQIKEEFNFAEFTAPLEFNKLKPLSIASQAWHNCNDKAWSTRNLQPESRPLLIAKAPVLVYNLSSQADFERYLRSSYCSDVRKGVWFEWAYDMPNFQSDPGEPSQCIQTKNAKAILNGIFDNAANDEYYGNYNDWLAEFRTFVTRCRKHKDSLPRMIEQTNEAYQTELVASYKLIWQLLGVAESKELPVPKPVTLGDQISQAVLKDLVEGMDADDKSRLMQVLRNFIASGVAARP